jgi:outer membrane protein, multidrug efflux system
MKPFPGENYFQAAVILLALLFSACTAVGPSYKAPKSEMPFHWLEKSPTVIERAGTNLAVWWSRFKDPVLDSLIQQAIASNQDLLIAETHIREARAQRVIAAAEGSPGVAATGAYTSIHEGENASLGKIDQDLFQAGFDANWELDIFGGIKRATEAAEASVAASVENKRDVLVSLVAEVARNYVELRGGQQRLAITRENISLQKQVVDMVERRFRVGFGSELEVVQARTQLALIRSQVPALKNSISRSRHQLSLLLGKTPEAVLPELAATGSIPASPPRIPVTLPSTLLRQRPDIRRAERQLAAATAEIGVSTAELFPRFSLSALLGLESVGLSNLVSSGSRFWSAGPKVQWSLFDAGKARAGVEISKSRRDRAQQVYEKTVLAALTEVEDTLSAYSREKESFEILQTAVDAARRAVDISKNQYSLGLVDFLNVLQTEQAFYQSRDRLVQSKARFALDTVALYKALGGGWQHPKEEKTPTISDK